MRSRLLIYAVIVLLSMLAVTSWASAQVALWKIPSSVIGHPWFVATLFDTYFAFVTFWLWVAYLEPNWSRRIAWLIAILILGNIAMAGYLLLRLRRFPDNGTMEVFLLRRRT